MNSQAAAYPLSRRLPMRSVRKARSITPALFAVISFACGSDGSGVEPTIPTTISIVAGNNLTMPPGRAVTPRPSVKVSDADANPVPNVQVTFAVTSGGGSVSGESQNTSLNGVATVGSWSLGSAVGPNTLTATAAGLSGSSVTFSAMADTDPGNWDY